MVQTKLKYDFSGSVGRPAGCASDMRGSPIYIAVAAGLRGLVFLLLRRVVCLLLLEQKSSSVFLPREDPIACRLLLCSAVSVRSPRGTVVGFSEVRSSLVS